MRMRECVRSHLHIVLCTIHYGKQGERVNLGLTPQGDFPRFSFGGGNFLEKPGDSFPGEIPALSYCLRPWTRGVQGR